MDRRTSTRINGQTFAHGERQLVLARIKPCRGGGNGQRVLKPNHGRHFASVIQRWAQSEHGGAPTPQSSFYVTYLIKYSTRPQLGRSLTSRLASRGGRP
jgi:hypothetical protein